MPSEIPSDPLKSAFVHLHVHSQYSIIDGSASLKDLLKKAKEYSQTHLALTDHGNMHGAVDFYLEAKKMGITPILGCEIFYEGSSILRNLAQDLEVDLFQTQVPFHMILLAKNNLGYKNLLKVVSSGYLGDSLKEVPIVSEKNLKAYSLDLVCLSGCMKGELGFFRTLLRNFFPIGSLAETLNDSRTKKIWDALFEYKIFVKELFPNDDYYVELIDNLLDVQKPYNEDLAFLANQLDLPLVATGDVHYVEGDFIECHAIAVAVKNSLTMNNIRSRLRHTDFKFLKESEIRERFLNYPEAISNTLVIAKKCSDLEIKMDTYYLPKIDLGTNETPKEAMIRLAREGLVERIEHLKPLYGDSLDEAKIEEYSKRLEYEISVIVQMGFYDYFLIVADFIGWAKKQGIPVGPGRGSGAGSLVAYALKITDIDPIIYNLIFERFLNPERISMPDFDVDFCQWRREEVINYCIQKYGASNVAQITTFGKMQAKGAVKSVGRALNVGYGRVDRFTKLFPVELGLTLKDALEKEPRLREVLEKDDALSQCVDYALRLEGTVSHTSVHAAGVVISDGPMTDYVPIYTTDGKSLITQYEMKPTEKVGLVKFDFLGLKTLTVVDKAVQMIRKNWDPSFDIAKIPIADKATFDLVSKGYTCGVFQCESHGMTQLVMKLQPSVFEDIIALVALFRPGPLGSGMVDDFIERKHGRQKILYFHPLLEPILKETYGMILYQEQVQKIAAVLANYNLGEADLLRRAMGKKIPEEMEKQKERFLQGAAENQVDKALSEEIFDLMAEFAKYGFNKSHSAAYGLISYQTAFLKTHFPAEFLAASMTCDMDNTDKIKRYVEDCVRFGIEVIPPCINTSEFEFSVPAKKKIEFALTAVKGVGQTVLSTVIQDRATRGPFKSLSDLANRVNLGRVGKKTLQLLNMVGAFDEFCLSRDAIDKYIPQLVDYSVKKHEQKAKGQRSLFDLDFEDQKESQSQEQHTWDLIPRVLTGNKNHLRSHDFLFFEKKCTGVFLSGHPLEIFAKDIKRFSPHKISDLPNLVDHKTKKKQKVSFVALVGATLMKRNKKGKLMASVRLEQEKEFVEAVIFTKEDEPLVVPITNAIVRFEGFISQGYDGTGYRLQANTFEPLENIRINSISRVMMKMSSSEENLAYLDSLKEIFESHVGSTHLRFMVHFPDAQVILESAYKIKLSDSFMKKLYTLPIDGFEFLYL